MSILIFCIGLLAQACFSARILIQWFLSEKKHEVISPTLFWVFSLIGSYFPAVRNIAGILRNDFPFPVCKRWIYQHRSAWTWHASDHVVLQCLDSPCRYHHRIGLEMDGIQYGILPLRYAEH